MELDCTVSESHQETVNDTKTGNSTLKPNNLLQEQQTHAANENKNQQREQKPTETGNNQHRDRLEQFQ